MLLRNELSLDAVLQQARELEGAADDLLPRVALREEGATLAAAGASWTLLRKQRRAGVAPQLAAASFKPGHLPYEQSFDMLDLC